MDRLSCDRIFVAVLDGGSFAAAAARHQVSSGQVSKMVARLETELGVQLIKRTTRSLSATEAGQAYYERIRYLLDEHDALDAAMRDAAGRPAGQLRLTAPVNFGNVWLAPVLLAFAQDFPAIRLDVSFTDRLVDLVDEGFDIAIRVAALADSSLVARKLCETRMVTVASPDYLARHGEPASPTALAGHECIADANMRIAHLWAFRGPDGAAVTVKVTGRLQFSDGEACAMAAERGLGIAHVPSFMVGPRLQRGVLVQILRGWEPPPRSVHALYPPARHLAPKVRAMIDFLAEHFRAIPQWDRGW